MPVPSDPTSVSIARQGTQIVTDSALNSYLFAVFDFAWTIVAAVRYRVRWDQGPTNGELLGIGLGSRRFTNLQISSAYPAHVFGLQVRAENDSGVSAWITSTPIDFTAPSVGSGTASTPGGVTSSNVKPRSFDLSWTSSNINVSYFECRVTGVTTAQNFLLKFPSIDRSAVVTGLLPAQTYLVEMRAVVGLGTSAGVTGTAPSAWRAAITAITSADAIQITAPSAGAVIQAWRSITYTTGAPACTIVTSNNAIVRSASGLPGTLAIVGSTPGAAFTIEGNVTAAAIGLTTGTINVTDAGANTDALSLNILVRDPAITIATAPQAGVVGSAFTYNVPWAKLGPIASPATWSLRFAPAFLAISAAGQITGTPDAPGTYGFEVKAGNGTQSDTQPLTLTVASIAITSGALVEVYQNGTVDFTLTANASAATWSALNLPGWLRLVGSKLSGSASVSPAEFSIQITASNGVDTATQLLLVRVRAIIRSDATWDLHLNQPTYQTVRYLGVGTIDHWYLSDAPPGLAINSFDNYGGDSRGSVTGSPSKTGVYDLIVTVQVTISGETYLFTASVTATVTGGLFLGWFHSDPSRRDLQLLLRSEEATSYYLAAGALRLTRGDHLKFYVIPRDAPIHDDELGRRLVLDGFTEIRFTIRPKDDLDAEPWLELGGAVVTESVGGNTIFVLEFDVTSDAIENAFARADLPAGAAPASLQLESVGEVSIIRNSVPLTFRGLPVAIVQDYDR